VSEAADLVRRYLRQRGELGETELVLDRLGPDLLRELAGVASRQPERPPARVAASEPAAAPDRAPARPPAPAPRLTRAAGVVPVASLASLDALRQEALGCPRCRLCETRNRVVFGEGSATADLMVVGEAPGADEDRTGEPFVGRAGKLLDLLLASVGFDRDSVYICNVLKCRPPGNHNPQPDEIEACSPFLRRQVELVRPRAILAVGGFAAQTLLGSTIAIGQLRGTVHEYAGTPLVPTYHPAALLRNPVWVRPVWDDLQRLRAVIDAA
jgi:uracil-DNA glycosylase